VNPDRAIHTQGLHQHGHIDRRLLVLNQLDVVAGYKTLLAVHVPQPPAILANIRAARRDKYYSTAIKNGKST
jgi:hypothetical protein